VLGVGAEGPVAPAATGSAVAHADDAPDRAAERDAWAVLAAAHGLGPVGFANLLRRLGSDKQESLALDDPKYPQSWLE